MRIKFALTLMFTLATALLSGATANIALGANPYVVAGTVMVIPLIKSAGTYLFSNTVINADTAMIHMAIQQEFWSDVIMRNLYPDDSFITKSYDESKYVIGGAVVHVPQAGAKVGVTKNLSSLPQTVVQRTDTDVTYALDVYDTAPQLITNAEGLEVSYNKAMEVVGEQQETLVEVVSDNLLYNWVVNVPSTKILRTLGASTTGSLAPSATGTRLKLIKEDLKRASALMNKDNVPRGNRYALIPSDMYQELLEDTDLIKRDGVAGGEVDLRNGILMKLYGFNIMERATTTLFTNAATPVAKLPTASAATTDNQTVVCWDMNSVTRAQGAIKSFEHLNSPTYKGDIFAQQVKMGGRARRADGKGVVLIIQTKDS